MVDALCIAKLSLLNLCKLVHVSLFDMYFTYRMYSFIYNNLIRCAIMRHVCLFFKPLFKSKSLNLCLTLLR